jgi:hypothetical protein
MIRSLLTEPFAASFYLIPSDSESRLLPLALSFAYIMSLVTSFLLQQPLTAHFRSMIPMMEFPSSSHSSGPRGSKVVDAMDHWSPPHVACDGIYSSLQLSDFFLEIYPLYLLHYEMGFLQSTGVCNLSVAVEWWRFYTFLMSEVASHLPLANLFGETRTITLSIPSFACNMVVI